jgi:hypothetical protein
MQTYEPQSVLSIARWRAGAPAHCRPEVARLSAVSLESPNSGEFGYGASLTLRVSARRTAQSALAVVAACGLDFRPFSRLGT